MIANEIIFDTLSFLIYGDFPRRTVRVSNLHQLLCREYSISTPYEVQDFQGSGIVLADHRDLKLPG